MTRSELGFAIRCLMRSSRSATLSTGLAHSEAWPYGSLVTVAIDMNGSPLLLFSSLSDHTRNIEEDDRASLLFELGSRYSNPQRGPRVTLLGRIRRTKNRAHAARFIDIHPEAKRYAAFSDFGYFKMRVERAHWVGGFADSQWLSGQYFVVNGKVVKQIRNGAASIIKHMNEDHADVLDLYANKVLKRRGSGWKIIGIDPDGIDLVLKQRFARLPFVEPVINTDSVRAALVDLAVNARD
ncbi:MAG: heme iron utilization protein [Magnetovibrio sp.]|nr:heme iron utilization protein [Magnetovibrio sp.]